MRCPQLHDLPAPPAGKAGWPWTGDSRQMPDQRPSGAPWPRISIVTPSYNQGAYLEATIRSVLLQGYPDLEYVIMDGGSTDGSVDIIRKYEPWLTQWTSAKDGGQYAAINAGFELTTGPIMGWINSDDMYLPGGLWAVGDIMASHEQVSWLSGLAAMWDCEDRLCNVDGPRRYDRWFLRIGAYEGRLATGWVQQESTLWRRDLWEKTGGLNTKLKLAADFDLWRRFANEAELYSVRQIIGAFRNHGDQKTSHMIATYFAEVDELVRGMRLGPVTRLIRGFWEGRIAERIVQLRRKHYTIFRDMKTLQWIIRK